MSKKLMKNVLGLVLSSVVVVLFFFSLSSFSVSAKAPKITDFITSLENGDGRVYKITGIDKNKTLKENVIDLLIPAPLNPGGSQATLWVLIRTIGVGVFIMMIIYFAGQLLLFGSDETRIKTNITNISIVVAGGLIFFGSVWILSTLVTLGNGVTNADTLVNNVNNKFILQILMALKALAFFVAIVALVVSAIKMMSAMDQEDKIKTARKGIMNIVLALLFIKLIDFIYYTIAQPNFQEPLKDVIIQVAVILGWILGVVLVGSVIVAGYFLIVDGGSGERAKKAKNILISIILSGLVVFLFLLVIYQLINEF